MDSSTSPILRSWGRLPAVVRGIVAGLVILQIGQIPPGVFLLFNLKFTPNIPWFLLTTAVWLWFFWQYLNGKGWPEATAQARSKNLRAHPIPGRIWLWSLLAGGLGMAGVMCLAFLTARLANVPQAAFNPPFDISAYPLWTKISIFLSIAAVAGVVEEAAFRGYMLSSIQRRHGWMAGILIAGLMFYLAHIGHAYATIAFLPFFLTYSFLQGILVYLTRSILPSVVLHAVTDFWVIPVQYGLTGDFLDFSAATYVVFTLVFAFAAIPAFYFLTAITRKCPAEESVG